MWDVDGEARNISDGGSARLLTSEAFSVSINLSGEMLVGWCRYDNLQAASSSGLVTRRFD